MTDKTSAGSSKTVSNEQLEKLQRSVAELGDGWGTTVAAWLIRAMCAELLTNRLAPETNNPEPAAVAMAKSLAFIWTWIDRMARNDVTVPEALSVLTHHPDTPGFVQRVGASQKARCGHGNDPDQCPHPHTDTQ